MPPKLRVWRSPTFLRFCHDVMKPAPCCLCGDRPWEALHHFGDDGGGSLKPSDNEVARLCRECHIANDLKRRGLLKSGKIDTLESFQNDALKLDRAYMEHLEDTKLGKLPAARCDGCRHYSCDGCDAQYRHAEPPSDCALEELALWLVSEGPGLGPDEQRDWLLSWSNRRSANVIDFLAEPMRQIATDSEDESARFVARRALRAAYLEGVEDGKDKDRMVR